MFFYVDHTTRFAHNTGIQRCVRLTARALLELGIPLCLLYTSDAADEL